MDYQTSCRSRPNVCYSSFVFWTVFKMSLWSSTSLQLLQAHNAFQERRLGIGGGAEFPEFPVGKQLKGRFLSGDVWIKCSAALLLPALGPDVFQLRSSVSGCQMSRLKKGAAWVIMPLPHISHRHVIPGVSGISPLVTTKTVTSAPCTWLQETGLRGLQQQQLRPKERSISSSHW